jgi:hypothetical protein
MLVEFAETPDVAISSRPLVPFILVTAGFDVIGTA